MAALACPLSYRLGAQRLRQAPLIRAPSTLYAVGGLYGNVPALRAIQKLALAEEATSGKPVTIVFNGDFNFFNASALWWRELNEEIFSKHVATAGNVEVESAAEEQPTGCGCGYPSYVSPGMVDRSDNIVSALWTAAAAAGAPELLGWLRELPKALVAEVGAARTRVGIIHGDVESLAGWQLGVEAMEPADVGLRAALGCDDASGQATHLPTTPRERIVEWCADAEVDGLLCTHTCLPFGQILRGGGGEEAAADVAVFNNGSAGMPNFAGERFGLITRVSDDIMTRPADSLYGGVTRGSLRWDALPVRYDHDEWIEMFEARWPKGSDAFLSYHERLLHGPGGFERRQAAREGTELFR